MMFRAESKNTASCYNVRQIYFSSLWLSIVKSYDLVTHLGDLSYKGTTSSVIFVSSLDITSKINILLFDLLSQLYNQLHRLIRYQFKIHQFNSTPQASICYICMRYWTIPIFSVLFPIYRNYNPNTTP